MLYLENTAPPSFFAAKWIPIIISILVVTGVSALAVLYYRHRERRSALVSALVTASLAITLLVLVIIPVDVYAVSSMKTRDGNFQPWAAQNATRQRIEHSIMAGYYVLYTMVFFVVFFLLPFAFFYHRESSRAESLGSGDAAFSARAHALKAVKWSLAFVLLLVLLITLGLVVPFAPPPPQNSTEWQHFQFIIHELETEAGEDVLSIILYSLSLVGMIAVVGYTGLGLSLWPVRLIRGSESLQEQREDVKQERHRLQMQINTLRDQANYATFPSWQADRLAELEREEAALARREQAIVRQMSTWSHRFVGCLRPVEVCLGFTVAGVGALIFTSLLLSNTDKALHSLGMKSGYVLAERRLPNPADWLLQHTDRLYPLDYIIYLLLIGTLCGATVACIQDIGVRVCAVKLYSVRCGGTRPHGLVLLALTLVYVLLAFNVLLLDIAPHYTMYGDQHYSTSTNHNGTITVQVEPCSTRAPAGECVLSRMALLLLRFSYKAWIFGAVFYWSTWLLLVAVVAGALLALCRPRPQADVFVPDDDEQEPLIATGTVNG